MLNSMKRKKEKPSFSSDVDLHLSQCTVILCSCRNSHDSKRSGLGRVDMSEKKPDPRRRLESKTEYVKP